MTVSAIASYYVFMSVRTGKDYMLIDHLSSTTNNDGQHSGTVRSSRGLTIDSNHDTELPATYVSPIFITEFPGNEAIMSWNANCPSNTHIVLEFRVRDNADSAWSEWFTTGKWKIDEPHTRNTQCPDYGSLQVDHFKSKVFFNEIQYSVSLFTSNTANLPLLRTIYFAITNTIEPAPENPVVSNASDLLVPWLSQHHGPTVVDRNMMECGVCGATSVTMVLRYYGIPAEVRDVGHRAYDPVANIYGNWAFLAATAAEYGPEAWVERFSSWKQIESYIISGTPVIISVAYPKGTFTAEPDKSTSGHLLVVRGFTESGDVIVNDPDTLKETRGNGYIYPASELEPAFFGHGGVGIVIKK